MMTLEEMAAKLQEALARLEKLEKEVLRLGECPECRGRPGYMCGVCGGSGRISPYTGPKHHGR